MSRPKHKTSRKNYELFQQVANNIKKYRKQRNLSQEQLQDETGLCISRHETGKYDITLTTLSILSEHLGVNIEQLLKVENPLPDRSQSTYASLSIPNRNFVTYRE